MKVEKSVKLRKMSRGNYGVTIPLEYVKALGWSEGEKVRVVLDTVEQVIIVKKEFQCIKCGKPVTLVEQVEGGVVEIEGRRGYLCSDCEEGYTDIST